MNDIHRAGRKPVIRPTSFYVNLLQQYQTMTTRELAKVYGVSSPTICNWLKRAREQQGVKSSNGTREKTESI